MALARLLQPSSKRSHHATLPGRLT
jgi:hypothetical protein